MTDNRNEMIFGLRAVLEAMQAGKEIDKILVKKDLQGDLARELFAALKGTDIPVQRVPVERLNRITRKNHQGVIAYMAAVAYQKAEDLVPFLFDVHDALEEGGRFIFSFHDSPRPDLGSGRSVPLWFSSEEAVTKYYTLYDMVNTLAAVGFSIRRIDEVEGDGIIHAVSLECVKGKV